MFYKKNPYLSFELAETKSTQENAGYSNKPEINEVLKKSKADLTKTVSEFCVEGNKVLDLGCGPGMYLELFKDTPYQLFAIDISQVMINDAKKIIPKAQFFHGDFIELLLDKKFNFIYCMGVLIYIPPHSIKTFFKKVYDSLEPNGIFYLNYPHAISWFDTVYNDITYIQYSPKKIESIIKPYFKIIKHEQAFDGKKVGAYDKNPYKSSSAGLGRTYKNSYLLIVQRIN
ncbi:MAG: class I SAM-dependent methyltransferase [Bacteroidia bacterium]